MPREEKQDLVGQVFRSVAPSYDIMNDLMSGGLHRLWKDRLVEKLRPVPTSRHLDVAGGTGDVAFRVFDAMRAAAQQPGRLPAAAAAVAGAAEAGAGGHITVCDINPAMLAEGQKKAAQRGISHASIDWVEGNAERLPFPDASFDSYTIAFGIRNVTNRQAALGDAYRPVAAESGSPRPPACVPEALGAAAAATTATAVDSSSARRCLCCSFAQQQALQHWSQSRCCFSSLPLTPAACPPARLPHLQGAQGRGPVHVPGVLQGGGPRLAAAL